MEHLIAEHFAQFPTWALLLIIAVAIAALGKGADMLVEEAVTLSLGWGVPKVVVGATIVSLGTTLPEAVVSVLAAVKGNPSLALGNAVGSIICDTGLILGIAAIMSPIKLDRKLVNRQGWIQFGAAGLMVLLCLPFSRITSVFSEGGNLPQWGGFLLMTCLGLYLWASLRWSGNSPHADGGGNSESPTGMWLSMAKLVFGVAMVIISAQVLIPAVQEIALRLQIPESIIGATLVAFGTSLPELVTAIAAVRKGHGELALGNVIGADILNALFVAGAAASVTPGGLDAPVQFWQFLFPAMLAVLCVFRIGVMVSKEKLGRVFGFALLGIYLAVTGISYFS